MKKTSFSVRANTLWSMMVPIAQAPGVDLVAGTILHRTAGQPYFCIPFFTESGPEVRVNGFLFTEGGEAKSVVFAECQFRADIPEDFSKQILEALRAQNMLPKIPATTETEQAECCPYCGYAPLTFGACTSCGAQS